MAELGIVPARPLRAHRMRCAPCRSRGCAALAALALATAPLASVATADPPVSDLPASWQALRDETPPEDPSNPAADASLADRARKDYAIPAFEVVGFAFLLNEYNRHFSGSSDYDSNASTIRRNLHSSWVVDSDPFAVNQLGHPYQGSMYYGFARSTGLSYWESLGYSLGGSALWEIAGESTPPSRNDLINTGVGGSFLGEALYRMANLALEKEALPPILREIGAAIISPALGFNRLAFGDRLNTTFASHDPEYYSRFQIGFSGSTQNDAGTSTTKLQRNEGLVDYAIDYGLPGKPGYTYDRPFDYFTFQATASSANGFENLMTRGLLVGTDYAVGADYRGVWGLYGNYDYFAPQTYRVSTTGLSLGTTGQAWLSQTIALQGSALLGAGYAASGTTRSTSDSDYHYGVAPQALVALRLIFGERCSIDLTGREYFVTHVGAAARGGHDNIARLDASFTVRVYHQHAITIKYLGNRRDAYYPDVGNSSQSRGTVGLFYTYLGHDQFGAVEWRPLPR